MDKITSITKTCESNPEQYEGTLESGKRFYMSVSYRINRGQGGFPKLKIKSYPKAEENDNRLIIYGWEMEVQHIGDTEWIIKAIALAPAIGLVILLVYSPWYMWLFYISNIDTLGLSASDWNRFCRTSQTVKNEHS